MLETKKLIKYQSGKPSYVYHLLEMNILMKEDDDIPTILISHLDRNCEVSKIFPLLSFDHLKIQI